ncbi:hypothetical protein PPERSA_09027 [Pseudocohnilembus persalinus]|uniref:Uncharacterized protein n=1 Tax=Pseudocohnilembus persalinus TaxID=266149 RepID=A0A0V0R354_PSEPJ|nr:hypothetical protein PPERSA_09027 [Pseudocohnilembus persalinus]|eukprot:KRX08923.1 hypothetical protein PPERSA_09027 [Pseudocohnilembus persalinus]
MSTTQNDKQKNQIEQEALKQLSDNSPKSTSLLGFEQEYYFTKKQFQQKYIDNKDYNMNKNEIQYFFDHFNFKEYFQFKQIYNVCLGQKIYEQNGEIKKNDKQSENLVLCTNELNENSINFIQERKQYFEQIRQQYDKSQQVK